MFRIILLVIISTFLLVSAWFIYAFIYVPPTTLKINFKVYSEKADYLPEFSASGKYAAYSVTNRINNETSGSIDVFLVELDNYEKKQIDHLETKFTPNVSGMTTHLYWIKLPKATQDQDVLLLFDNSAAIPHLCKEYFFRDGVITTQDFSNDEEYIKQIYNEINYSTNIVSYHNRINKFYYKRTLKYSMQYDSIMPGTISTYELIEVYNQKSLKIGQIVIPKSNGEEVVWGSSNRLFIRFPQEPLWDATRVNNYYQPIIYYTAF